MTVEININKEAVLITEENRFEDSPTSPENTPIKSAQIAIHQNFTPIKETPALIQYSFTHDDFLDIAKELQYTTLFEDEESGACEGCSYLVMLSGISGTIDAVQERFNKLGELLHECKGSRETKIKTVAKLIAEASSLERQYDILPFFEGAALLQSPELYRDLFSKDNQASYQRDPKNIETLLERASSLNLTELGGTARLSHWSGVYDSDELVSYLNQIEAKCKNAPTDDSLGILLSSGNHTTSLVYDQKNNRWIFMDINELPVKISCDSQIIAQHIIKAFSYNPNIPAECVILHSDFYSLKQSEQYFKQALNDWHGEIEFKKLHQVNAERVNKIDSYGYIWLNHITRHGTTHQTLTQLQWGANPNHVDEDGISLLSKAISREYEDLSQIEALLDYGSDPDSFFSKTSPLYFAALLEKEESVKLLLNHEADPDLGCKKEDMTPLSVAAQTKNLNIAALLLKYGADPNKASVQKQKTPLHIAAKQGDLDLIEILLDYGANPNLPSITGSTPLHLAVKQGHLEAVKVLLKFGAKPQIVNRAGKTPLSIALKKGYSEILQILKKI